MNRKLIYITIALLTVFMADAQESKTGFFLKTNLYRHRINPAVMNETGYVAVPGIGNVGISTASNMGLSDYFFPTANGQLTTFMNGSVDANTFLKGLDQDNHMNYNVNATLLAGAFHAWGGYNTVDLSIKNNVNGNLPYDLFRFVKLGMDAPKGSTYHIPNVRMGGVSYADLSFGHARQMFDERLTLGAKVKFLFGIANASTYISNMNITMEDTGWMIDANGDMSVSGGSTFNKDETGKVTGIDFKPGLCGFGMGVDLGATFKLTDRIDLGLSVLDLGFIGWSKTIQAKTNNSPYKFDGFENFGVLEESENPKIGDLLDQELDIIKALANVYETNTPKNPTDMLRATLHASGEYTLIKDQLSFGLLYTGYFAKSAMINGAMVTANYSPAKWFGVAVAGNFNTMGVSYGWTLNFNPKYFNFFIGSDFMITKVTPQYVPVNDTNASFYLGFNIPLNFNMARN